MSDELTDILTSLDQSVKAEQVFENARVYHRGEEATDLPVEDVDAPSVYLKALDPVIPSSDFYLNFLQYPVQVVVKFEARNDESLEDDERDAVQAKRFGYIIALKNMVKRIPTNLGSIVFKVDAKDVKIDIQPDATLKKSDEESGQQIHRVGLTLTFQTVQPYA